MRDIHFYPITLLFLGMLFSVVPSRAQSVLIIQDERPQMEVLADYLQNEGKLKVEIVDQQGLPGDLSGYKAVIVYIHKKLFEATELAIIDYAKNGGRLVLLHHSISSGKASNKYYFDFLGIRLDDPEKSRYPVEPGKGYAWVEGVTLTLVNLNPGHFITSHHVQWEKEIAYQPSDWPSVERNYPCLELEHSEVYLNHKFTDGREKTVLLGLKFFDERNGRLFMQDRAGWIKRQGKGLIVYLMPGHAASDYENENVAQMVLNAVVYSP